MERVHDDGALGLAAMTAGDAVPPAKQEVSPGRELGDLLLRHRRGEPGAFEALVRGYRSPVFGYLVRCGVDGGDRDDLFQEIFIRVHRASGSYDGRRPIHPWLFTIVANAVRTYHRRRRVHEIAGTAEAPYDPSRAIPDGERSVAARETVAWLEREIPLLPLAQREVLVLATVEGMALADVARALGMPLNTVKTHLRRARLGLAERLAAKDRGEVTP